MGGVRGAGSLVRGERGLELRDDRVEGRSGLVLEALEGALDGVLHLRSPRDELGILRPGRESRYCSTTVDGDGRGHPSCIDLAAWPAIAGDHSCSPDQLIQKTLTSDWILRVARVGAETKVVGLEKARNRDAALNEWATSHLKLQFVDPEYVSRAGANNGHFLMIRTSDDPGEYLREIFAPDAEPSALALYVYYHLGAMALSQG